MASGAGWAQARDVLAAVLRDSGVRNTRDAMGRVRFLGEGLSHVVYGATCLLGDGSERSLVVKLPRRDPMGDREDTVRREARLLHHVARLKLPFRVPNVVAEVALEGGLALVQEWVEGIPANLRADRFPAAWGRPWEFVGRVAAAVHAIDPEPLRVILAGHPTRRDHAVSFARVLDQIAGPEGGEARAWVADHVPPAEPSRLLHGDLLGQNLHLSLEDDIPGVVDWGEALLGDPAYDLAIVTRGVRRPFGKEGGLHLLVDAYNRHAVRPLTTTDVHLHEVLLTTKWYLDAGHERGVASSHAEEQRNILRSVLRRAKARA